jgi:hypothetical protein
VRSNFIYVLLSCGFITPGFAQNAADKPSATGTVEGIVVDANNKLTKDASVYADNLSMPAPARPHIALTDAQGHFVVDEVYPGQIVMRAFKEADKYADITGTFDEPIGETHTELEMKAGDDFKGVVIRLGQKAGLLRWRVFDAGTNEPIKGITFQMCRGDHPSDRRYCMYGSARGDSTWFIPALAPISISVSAPNYSDWTYQDKKSPYIALAPGEERTLKIKLQPAGTK